MLWFINKKTPALVYKNSTKLNAKKQVFLRAIRPLVFCRENTKSWQISISFFSTVAAYQPVQGVFFSAHHLCTLFPNSPSKSIEQWHNLAKNYVNTKKASIWLRNSPILKINICKCFKSYLHLWFLNQQNAGFIA